MMRKDLLIIANQSSGINEKYFVYSIVIFCFEEKKKKKFESCQTDISNELSKLNWLVYFYL